MNLTYDRTLNSTVNLHAYFSQKVALVFTITYTYAYSGQLNYEMNTF